MKNLSIVILSAIGLASIAVAAPPAPLPAFAHTAKFSKNISPEENSASNSWFFTGKPHLSEGTSFAFLFRNYDPSIARWTSSDPSGFPDGANSHRYASVPTCSFDVAGLLDWATLQNANQTITYTQPTYTITFEVWKVKTNDGSATIDLWKYVSGNPPGLDYTYNCHGYTFGNSQYWINGQVDDILKGDGYKKITGADKSGAKVAYWGSDVHTAVVNKVESGTVTEVTGKRGANGMLTSTPAGQGYAGTIEYYE